MSSFALDQYDPKSQGLAGFGGKDYDFLKGKGVSDDQMKHYLQVRPHLQVGSKVRETLGVGRAAAKKEPYTFKTTSGSYLNQGLTSLVDIGNKYKDNETIGGLVSGSLIDVAKTQAQTGLALGYQTAMASNLAKIQGGLENLRTGNTMKLMSAEGGIKKDLLNVQGDWQLKGIRETGAEKRKGYVTQGEQNRLALTTQGEQKRLSLQTEGEELRKGIRETGSEERKKIAAQTKSQLGLRADARGAIRSTGSRFYG